ncbi:hypothetical protein [Oleiagrimonas soli]|uniref:Uncharacterized protein n=1 Tax=Oleiagrimonas soli TaxID=1543381 RepID=A0A099CT12_9GAMM|nr:hypothetical protein [Oleiagrimonas soli]KGI77088.1 hypothetical protein LF63_0112635 [Oleiagrimonas soli]MBB6185378.1 hypothetical protein [Oleiagrimonas soli]
MIGHAGHAPHAPAKAHASDLPASADTSAPFTVCKATYALCIQATPMGNNPSNGTCTVQDRWWAGAQTCGQLGMRKTAGHILSRDFPIKSFVACSEPTT